MNCAPLDYSPLIDFINLIITSSPALGMAMLGGWASVFWNGKTIKEDASIFKYIIERTLAACFSGLIVFFLLHNSMQKELLWAIVGMTGFASTEVLPILKSFLLSKMQEKIQVLPKKSKESKEVNNE